MAHRKVFDDGYVDAVELIQWEGIVEIRFLARNGVQLPFQQIGRHAPGLGQASTIEFAEICETLTREPDTVPAVSIRCGRQLTFELGLLLAGKITRRSREIRIAAHPFGREIVEEFIDGLRVR